MIQTQHDDVVRENAMPTLVIPSIHTHPPARVGPGPGTGLGLVAA